MPTCTWVHAVSQPANIARPVFGIYRSAVGQFAVQHDARFIPPLADEYPVARLIDFAEVSMIQIRIAYNGGGAPGRTGASF